MHAGHTISGTAHAALILWVLFGGVFRSTPDEVRVQDVSVLSEEQFAALQERAQPPESTQDVAAPPQPDTDAAPAPMAEPAPAPAERPEAAPAPSPPQEEALDSDPVPDPPAPEPQVEAPRVSERPIPRPAPRVAPDPVPETEPDVPVAEEPVPPVVPEPAPDAVPEPPREAAQPEAAAPEIVTEAEEPAAAPLASVRPQTRPNRPAPVPAPAPIPEPPTETAAPAPDPAPQEETATAPAEPAPAIDPVAEAVADAVAEALASGGTTAPDPDVPVGPPMTAGEKDALRVAVQRCWVVDVGSQAANVTVTVGMDMTQGGQVVTNSIRLLNAAGGSGGAAETAFQAARRAILRCQGDGYALPPEKYGQWKEIEMTFDPSGMRIR